MGIRELFNSPDTPSESYHIIIWNNKQPSWLNHSDSASDLVTQSFWKVIVVAIKRKRFSSYHKTKSFQTNEQIKEGSFSFIFVKPMITRMSFEEERNRVDNNNRNHTSSLNLVQNNRSNSNNTFNTSNSNYSSSSIHSVRYVERHRDIDRDRYERDTRDTSDNRDLRDNREPRDDRHKR